jgi:predicted small lipoprotein YifL
MYSKNNLLKIMVLIVVFSMVLSACGGSQPTEQPATSAPATDAPVVTDVPVVEKPTGNLVMFGRRPSYLVSRQSIQISQLNS